MGGNQFGNNYVSRINLQDIKPTVNIFFELVISKLNPSITRDDFKIIGSQGKKSSSGDIDTGLNIYKFIDTPTFDNKVVRQKLFELEKKIREIIYSEDELVDIYSSFNIDIDVITKVMNFGCLSVLFPQFNNHDLFIGKFVQIDVFLGDLDWLEKFQMSGYIEEDMQDDQRLITKYKGVYRNLLFQQILRVFTIDDKVEGDIRTITKYTQDYTGLYILTKQGQVDKPYKSYKTVGREKVNKGFLEFWREFFNDDSLTEYDLQTFENFLKYISENPITKPVLDKIIEEFKELCIMNKVEIPKIVDQI